MRWYKMPGRMLLAVVVILVSVPWVCSDLLGDDTPVDDYVEEGDLNLAVMLPLYYSADGKVCRNGRRQWVIQIAHSVRYTLEKANNDPNILPNTTLGVVLLNDCARPSIAAGRATQLVEIPECSRTGCSGLPQSPQLRPSHEVIGVVGFSSSSKATQASSVLSHYKIPHISWLATSDDLSLKVNYEYFSRTQPPDIFTTRAMVDMVGYFNWTYISVLATEGSFGVNAVKNIIRLSDKIGVCIAYTKIMEAEMQPREYEEVISDLRNNSRAHVVLVVLNGRMVRELFRAAERMDAVGEFIFIGTDSFVYAISAYAGIDHLFVGSFGVITTKAKAPDFETWYETLPPVHKVGDNIWFGQYLAEDLQCSWDAVGSDTDCSVYADMKVSELPGFSWDPTPPRMMDSVQAFVVALHQLITDKCPTAFGNTQALRACVDGSDLLTYIRNVSFPGYVQQIEFDAKGDLKGGYDIVHFETNADGSGFRQVRAGVWSSVLDDVNIDDGTISWYKSGESEHNDVPESVCAKPCGTGEFYIQGEVTCCWQCHRCRDNERLLADLRGCVTCGVLTWPDQVNFTTCEDIAPTYMLWTDGIALGLEALAGCGILTFLFITGIFLKHSNKKVIKGSSRELMFPILFGILVAFGTVYAYIVKPNDISCAFTYFSFHLCCTFIFAPLLLKTVRMYRIFAAAEKCKLRVRFIDGFSQVVIFLGILVLQVCLTVIMFLFEQSRAVMTMPVDTERFVELHCFLSLYTLLIPLSVNIFLLLLCAIFGFLTRKLPDNFNESWYIFIADTTTLFIWTAFLPTHMIAFYAYHKAALLALALILNSIVTIVCLFVPKIFAVYFVPEDKIKVSNFEASEFTKSEIVASTGPEQ